MPEGAARPPLRTQAVASDYAPQGYARVEDIHFTPTGQLVLLMKCESRSASVTFHDPIGFRVLDERDLLEFWPQCSTPAGWLFEVFDGGWMRQQLDSSHCFTSHAMSPEGLREFFVTGPLECVSVITRHEAPVVRLVGAPATAGRNESAALARHAARQALGQRIESRFGRLGTVRPTFVKRPGGLRFRLSEGGAPVTQFLTAFDKARTICADVFNDHQPITVALGVFVQPGSSAMALREPAARAACRGRRTAAGAPHLVGRRQER